MMPVLAKPKDRSATPVSKLPENPGDVAKPMAAAALVMSAAGQHVNDAKVKKMMTDGPLDLYQNIERRDALDSMLAMLAASVTSASLDCLAQAALCPPEHLQLRDLNLRHGLKGATVAAALAKALDNRHPGQKSEKVTVGKVNVEAGGQAIVGNIESAPHPDASSKKHSKAD
jgi:hypothetical protein